jgi:hypothetical protein
MEDSMFWNMVAEARPSMGRCRQLSQLGGGLVLDEPARAASQPFGGVASEPQRPNALCRSRLDGK